MIEDHTGIDTPQARIEKVIKTLGIKKWQYVQERFWKPPKVVIDTLARAMMDYRESCRKAEWEQEPARLNKMIDDLRIINMRLSLKNRSLSRYGGSALLLKALHALRQKWRAEENFDASDRLRDVLDRYDLSTKDGAVTKLHITD